MAIEPPATAAAPAKPLIGKVAAVPVIAVKLCPARGKLEITVPSVPRMVGMPVESNV
jgi:hypothetical protein